MYYVLLFPVTLSQAINNLKFLNHEISHGKKIEPTKYPPEKILDPQNTHVKKF